MNFKNLQMEKSRLLQKRIVSTRNGSKEKKCSFQFSKNRNNKWIMKKNNSVFVVSKYVPKIHTNEHMYICSEIEIKTSIRKALCEIEAPDFFSTTKGKKAHTHCLRQRK